MVSLLLLALSLPEAPEAPSAVGVLRIARGEVRGPKGPIRSGALVRPGDRITVQAGWAELMLGPDARLRVSAETEIAFSEGGEPAWALDRGRVWVELAGSATVSVRLGELPARLAPGTAAVLEPGLVAVFAGAIHMEGVRIQAGQANTPSGPRAGGGELHALVRREAKAAVGDLEGWRAVLLRLVKETKVGDRPPPRFDEVVEPGALRGEPFQLLLEEALRPAPFPVPAETP